MITTMGERIMELRKQKVSLKTICKQLGCSQSTVSKYCAMLNNNDEISIQNRIDKDMARRVSMAESERQFMEKIFNTGQSLKVTQTRLVRTIKKIFLLQSVGFACQVCKHDHLFNLQFHHKDQNSKIMEVSMMMRTNKPLPDIVKEAEKCIVICANCHGDAHYHSLDVSNIPTLKITYEIPKRLVEWYYLNQDNLPSLEWTLRES